MTEQDKQGIAASAASVTTDTPMFKRTAWARILPFITYIAFIVAADLLERLGFTAAELRWMYGAKIAAVLLVLALFWRQYHELKSPRLSLSGAALAIGAGVAVLVLWIFLDAGWMVIGSPEGFDPRGPAGQIDWPLALVRIGGAALVVPLMEELFWRSFLMRWIDAADFEKVDPAQISLKSFIISSVLFGFEHNLWLAGIVAGLAYSALYMRHRTVWSPVLAHAVTNGLLGIWVVSTGNWTYW
jgi:CAAX prenyl protease-like protein